MIREGLDGMQMYCASRWSFILGIGLMCIGLIFWYPPPHKLVVVERCQLSGWKMSTNPSLVRMSVKGLGRSAFVKTSVSWPLEEIGSNRMSPTWTFSRTKWQSISRCFVRSWKTGFATMCKALWLSQYKTAGLEQEIFKSWSK